MSVFKNEIVAEQSLDRAVDSRVSNYYSISDLQTFINCMFVINVAPTYR